MDNQLPRLGYRGRYVAMKLALSVGLPAMPFGTSYEDVLEQFGPPVNEQLLADVATHPGSRRVLTYDDYDLTIAPALGLFAISVDAETIQIEILDTTINSLSPEEFGAFLQANDCAAEITKPDGFGDQDVHSVDNGIIASFSESKLTSFELHDPQWRAAARQSNITTA